MFAIFKGETSRSRMRLKLPLQADCALVSINRIPKKPPNQEISAVTSRELCDFERRWSTAAAMALPWRAPTTLTYINFG